MVFKDYTFFSYVFLATVIILFTGHAHGAGLCDNSPNTQVCYSIVYNRTDPYSASVALCNKLIYETKVAKVVAQKQAKSPEIEQCIKEFDSSISYTKVALVGLRGGHYPTLQEFISATQVNYQYCDSQYQKSGKTNPIAKSTKHLEDIAGVGAYLVNLLQ
uniref:Pectinesterase inhibitor domain-containing protein n=1 Tax=Quercus lobata TaxID=97700 RepID=A0A7N2LIP8_QUELO